MIPDWFAYLMKWIFFFLWFAMMFDGLGRL